MGEKMCNGKLTTREIEILSLAAQGYTNEEIAAELFISYRTVKRHFENIYKKLNIGFRGADRKAIAYYYENLHKSCI